MEKEKTCCLAEKFVASGFGACFRSGSLFLFSYYSYGFKQHFLLSFIKHKIKHSMKFPSSFVKTGRNVNFLRQVMSEFNPVNVSS